MKPIEIGEAYDQITHLWSSENFNLKNGIEQHEKAITFSKNTGRALDIGCGCTGRFIDLLLKHSYQPEGLDISEKMISLTRERHPDITLHHGDICSWSVPHKYDFITAWDSIWHIPLEEQKSVISKIINALNPGGVFIFSFGATEAPGEHKDSTMGPEVYYSTLGTNGFLSLLIKLGCVCRHFEMDQFPELHGYIVVEKLKAP